MPLKKIAMAHDLKLDFIGIGTEKSGTTSLFRYLNGHPEIYFSPLKNLKYFYTEWENHPELSRFGYTYDDYVSGKAYRNKFVISLNEYHRFFNAVGKQKLKGEFSPGYICLEESPFLIHQYNPKIKIFAIIRNPIDRAYSQFMFHRQKQIEKETNFMHCLNKEDVDNPLVFNQDFRSAEKPKTYLRQGLYYKNLKRYFDLFPKENIKIVLYDELKKNPLNVTSELFNFLGVDEKFKPNFQEKHNVTINTRNKNIGRLLNIKLPSSVLKMTPRKLKNQAILLKQTILNANKEIVPKLSKSERQWILKYFENDIRELEVLIEKDLSHWIID